MDANTHQVIDTLKESLRLSLSCKAAKKAHWHSDECIDSAITTIEHLQKRLDNSEQMLSDLQRSKQEVINQSISQLALKQEVNWPQNLVQANLLRDALDKIDKKNADISIIWKLVSILMKNCAPAVLDLQYTKDLLRDTVTCSRCGAKHLSRMKHITYAITPENNSTVCKFGCP